MHPGFRLGRIFGIPIIVKVSFLVLLGLVALTMGGMAGVATVLIAFGSVLLHELGHSVVARWLDVRVATIELHFFGGAAQLVDPPRRAEDEIAISAAGPAVSFTLAGLAFLLASVTGAGWLMLLAWINVVIGAFNLIPALPLDGGRILRAILSKRWGYSRATVTAARIGRYFAVALGIFGLLGTQLFVVAIAVVVWLMASSEMMAARLGHHGYRNKPEVEILGRAGTWEPIDTGYGAESHDYHRQSPFDPMTRGRFVIRRHGRGFSVEPLD